MLLTPWQRLRLGKARKHRTERRRCFLDNGHDEALAIILERLSQERDVARETGVFDEAAGPHDLNRVVRLPD